MIDTNIERSAPGPIPVLSPIAHFAAVTVVVFLRSSFGFDFLRPKSVFFGVSWFWILLTKFISYYPSLWREYRATCIFGISALALYWLHLAISAYQNIGRKAEHDLYAGTSHLLLPLRRFIQGDSERLEKVLHVWIEPTIVVLAATILRALYAEPYLSLWLILAAACLFFTELNTYWVGVRRPKKLGDIRLEAEEQDRSLTQNADAIEQLKETRKDGVIMPRNTSAGRDREREEHFVKLLRLRVPYSVEEAEENYRTLAKLEHPRTNDNSPESNAAMAELNEAIAFIRARSGR